MKFLCEHCKAKYQIADEKVAGRTVRMKCRKCGGQIEVRAAVTETSVAMKAADLAAADTSDPGKEPLTRPATRTSPLARPPTQAPLAPRHGQKDGPLAGAFQRNVQRDEDATAAGLDLRELSAADEWYVAVNGVPVGPVRVGEVRRKAAMGAVTEESLCWQEGMEEWRAIRTVTELAAVVREAASGGRASLLPAEPRSPTHSPPGRPPPPKQRPSRAPAPPTAPAAPAWSKPSAGPLAQAQPQAHRPFDDSDEGQPTVVGRSALLDDELSPPAPIQWTNGASGAADPFAPAPDPFKAPAPPPPSSFGSSPLAPSPFAASPFAASPLAVGAPAPAEAAPVASAMPPAPLSVAPAARPAKPRNPIVLGMMVMFGCFGAVAAWFIFGPTKPAPAPIAPVVTAAAPSTPTGVPTDIPPPVAGTAPTAPPVTADAGPAKVASSGSNASNTGTRPGTTSTAPASSGKATASTDPALRELINGAGTGPATGPGGTGAGGGPKLTEDDVRGVVMQKQTQLKRTCWEKIGSTVPSVNVLVHIVVNGSGAVTSATATGNDPVVGHCLETQIKQWHWPGGGEVDVPFHFLRQ